MAAEQSPSAPSPGAVLAQLFRKPQFLLPMVVVAGMLGIAFGVQPGGTTAGGQAAPDTSELYTEELFETAEPSPSPTATGTETATTTATASATPSSSPTPEAPGDDGLTNEVAGARETATVTPGDPDFSRQPTECGPIQETSVPVGVEQNIAGVAVRAQGVSVYPTEYLRCILLATGGQEAVTLSTAVGEAAARGSTHAVLIDLWITNVDHSFAQVNLKNATISAAGQTFSPIATLGGRGEVVVASGKGRNVTLVGVLANDVGATTGPMTLTIDAPLAGGHQLPGKYQLFLPTP